MYLQRLIKDRQGDLNYDYMGSAEFEFGATARAREALARLQIEGKIGGKKVRLFEKWGRSNYGPVEAFVFGEKSYIAKLGKLAPVNTVLDDLVLEPSKENTRIDNPKYIGWMQLDPWKRGIEPLLILRATDENIALGNKFLQHFIDQILEDENERSKKDAEPYGPKCAICGQERDCHIDRIDARPDECDSWVNPAKMEYSGH